MSGRMPRVKPLRYNAADVPVSNFYTRKYDKYYMKDMLYGGAYSVTGVVKENAVPSRNRLVLLDRACWVTVRSCVSNENGQFRFDNLTNEIDFILVAVDDQQEWEALAFDFVRAE